MAFDKPKVRMPPAPPTPADPVLKGGGTPSPQAGAFSRFSFAPSLVGMTPRTGGRRSLLGG
jgi:hypothetical protein